MGTLVRKILVLTLLSSVAAFGQPTFKSSVDAVLLSAVVTDKKGSPILTLDQQNFEVQDNQEPQELKVFVAQNIPIDVAIVLDNSISMRHYMRVIRSTAIRLIEKLREAQGERTADRAMLLFANGGTPFPLTEDKESLKLALNDPKHDAVGPTLLYKTIHDAITKLTEIPKTQELRKQIVVVLSDGIDTMTKHYREIMMELVMRSPATIYTLRTIGKMELDSEKHKKLIRTDNEDLWSWKQLAPLTGGLAFDISLDDGRDDVQKITNLQNKLNAAFGEIGDEFSRQYFMGFIPKPSNSPGEERRLSVLLKGLGGRVNELVVRTRTRYLLK